MKNPNRNGTRLNRNLLAAALAGCLAIGAMPAFAQSANATLRGKAPAGAQVTAVNTTTGQVRKVAAAADGSYALAGLPPGTYRVDAGPGTEQTVTLAVATSVSLNLGAGAAPAGDVTTLEGVTVVGTALQEVKTSEVGTSVSLDKINKLPQLTRNFLEFADTVPGVQFTTDSTGHSDIRGGSQPSAAVNVYIDGVGQKSYLFGGVSGQQQSAGNPFPQLAIGEYKVITSNYKAEFDQVGSAAIVASTKYGTNELHGEVFGRRTNSSWRTSNPAEDASPKGKQDTHQTEYGFALGGPIVRDRAHFFVSYEHKDFVLPADPVAVPGNFSSYSTFLPSAVQAKYGPVTRPFEEDLYFAKLDWDITPDDRLEFSAKLRREDSRDSVGGNTTADAAKNNHNEEDRYDLRWVHYGQRYLNEARFTYEDVLFNPTAYTIGHQSVYTRLLNENDVLLFDDATSGLAIQNKGQKGWGFQDDLTFNDVQWHGDHVVKLGFKYKQLDLTQSENSTLNPSFYYAVNDGSAAGPTGTSAIPYQVRFNLPFAGGIEPTVTTSDKQYGLYIQDDWDVSDRLQLNIGVRWDYEEIPSYQNHVTPAPLVNALLNGHDPTAPAGLTYAQQLALGGIDINDYISTGNNRKADKNNWAPRLGFSYDLTGDERHVLFGGIGRSFDRNLYDWMGLEQVKYGLAPYTIRFTESSGCTPTPQQCLSWNPAYLDGGAEGLAGLVGVAGLRGEPNMLNNDLKTPYSDQFSLGIRSTLGEWHTSAAVAHIRSKEGLVFTLGNRYPDGAFWGMPSWGGIAQPWEHAPQGFGNLILANNGIETKTTQLLLSADKPYTRESGWGVSAAYTYSHATGNRGGDEHYAFDGATIEDYPFIDLKAVPKHRLVVTGIYDLPWDISLSGKLTLASPPPLNEILGAGSFNRPTATIVALDAPGNLGTKEFDLTVSKDFHVGEAFTLQVRGDVLNVFDWTNYNAYNIDWDGSGSTYDPEVTINRTGGISTPTRTFFLSARLFW